MIQSFAGLRGIVDTATRLARNGRPFTDPGRELASVAGVTREELNELARRAVPLDRASVLDPKRSRSEFVEPITMH